MNLLRFAAKRREGNNMLYPIAPKPCAVSVSSYQTIPGVLTIAFSVLSLGLFIFLLISIISNLKNRQNILNKRNIIIFSLLVLITILIPLSNMIYNNIYVSASCG